MGLKTFGIIALLGLVGIAVLSFAQAAPPPDAPGNILDRIIELENRIDVLESQVADLQEQGGPGAAVHLGEWQQESGWRIHQAETDGFVVCYGEGYHNSILYPLKGWTHHNFSEILHPNSLRFSETIDDLEWRGCIMPVRAGDYWRVDNGDESQSNYFYVYWIPLIPG